MAYKLILPRTYNGMTHIWNVSEQVGDMATCPNKPTDVDLVSMLIAGYLRGVVSMSDLHQSCKIPFPIDGNMNIHIAYWIRIINRSHHDNKLSLKDEGIISRAKRASFGPNTWSIVALNYTYYLNFKGSWEDFPNHPQCPPLLKKELLDKTSP